MVNTVVPVVTYANWFSYTLYFVSQNHELWQAVRTTRQVLKGYRLRWVADAGFDERQKSWESQSENLAALVEVTDWQAHWEVGFNHAGVVRQVKVAVGWYKVWLPQTKLELWVLVVDEEGQ
jgi:hypothetical protein